MHRFCNRLFVLISPLQVPSRQREACCREEKKSWKTQNHNPDNLFCVLFAVVTQQFLLLFCNIRQDADIKAMEAQVHLSCAMFAAKYPLKVRITGV
jgi:hypothetical protein